MVHQPEKEEARDEAAKVAEILASFTLSEMVQALSIACGRFFFGVIVHVLTLSQASTHLPHPRHWGTTLLSVTWVMKSTLQLFLRTRAQPFHLSPPVCFIFIFGAHAPTINVQFSCRRQPGFHICGFAHQSCHPASNSDYCVRQKPRCCLSAARHCSRRRCYYGTGQSSGSHPYQ